MPPKHHFAALVCNFVTGRDSLACLQGIAKTGSGKTAAFVLPMLVHIMDQPEVEKGAGPIGIIVVPTRELAEQIHKETRRFSKTYQLRVSAAFGGLSKFEQFKDLKSGSEVCHFCTHHCTILLCMPSVRLTESLFGLHAFRLPHAVLRVNFSTLHMLFLHHHHHGALLHRSGLITGMGLIAVQVAVCTPGRMIDLIKMKACSMLRVTYLVFDEADRMFDMGFEPQVSTATHMIDSIKHCLSSIACPACPPFSCCCQAVLQLHCSSAYAQCLAFNTAQKTWLWWWSGA